MADPVLVSDFPYIYFTCNRDPTSNEPVLDATGLSGSGGYFFWWNQTTNNFFMCINAVTSDYLWQQITTSANILSNIDSAGWNVNTARSYSLMSSPAFNTSYKPSTTNDTMVSAVVSCTSTLITPGTVLFEVNAGSGFSTIGEFSTSGIAASLFGTITCLVPANSSYQLVNSSGTASIISLNEVQL